MPGKGRTPGFFLKSYSLISFFSHIRWPIQKVFLLTTRTKILSQIKNLGDKVNCLGNQYGRSARQLHSTKPPYRSTKISCWQQQHTDDDILEEFNTVNETIMDDYSQASTAALSSSQEPDVSQM